MKKSYFIPSRLPKVNHKFARGAAYLSDGDDAEQKALLEKIEKRVSKALEGRATAEELKQIKDQLDEFKKGIPVEELRAMANADTGVMKTLANQGLEIQRLKQTIDQQPKDMSVRSQIKAWMETNKEAIQAIRSGHKQPLSGLEIKLEKRVLASPMLPSTVLADGKTYITKTEVQSGVVDVLREDRTFWNFLRKGTTGSETYVWVNRKNIEGAAAFIAPGIYKPGVSFALEAELSVAKKIAANEKMATELLDDIEGFQSFVEDELYNAVMDKVNLQMTTGTGSSTAPAGVTTYGVPYSLTTIKTENPNYWDCVKAAVTQLRIAKFRGQFVCLINPIDMANMLLTKAQSQGQLFIPPAVGAEFLEDNTIPVGKICVVAMDYYKVKIYKQFSMSYGWENDDFTKNLLTVIGEMRLHQYVSENHLGFCIYDDFADVVTALTPTP